MPSFTLTAAVLGTPDPRGLARFYQRLLDWPLRDDTDEWATLRPADGSTGLSFQREPGHVPPVWPPEPGTQQMQQHLDILVDDLAAACAVAEDAGAEHLGGHEDDAEIVRVYRDPAGHPFCLFVRR
ncbi:putative enzyme related to lactoylglutathione lyase [Blastococcus colisei]|uniref:Putative enzyme related to lactoylglutathione lyase n=1 Tax=Blastococcus colisei TaxID=1564162 RepID=A0A543PJX3_9ACTN|nr:VOC family protein [Blastococcus colisei]TQN44372.1 putative enzyme related to lactoylglutathione lyase [Blastococcus colisei]